MPELRLVPLPQTERIAEEAISAGFTARSAPPNRREMERDIPIDRIVVINDFSIAKGGGTGLALLSMRLFRQLGIPVTFLCGDDGNNPDFISLDIETVALGGKHILTGKRQRAAVAGLHNAAAQDMLCRWIAENDTARTVYHVHGWSKIMSPSLFLALAPVADRSVLHAHDFFLACPNGAFYDYRQQAVCECRPLSLDCATRNCDKRNYGQKLWRLTRSARLKSVLLKTGAAYNRVLLLHEKMAPAFQRSGYPPAMLHALRNPVLPYCRERVPAEDNRDLFYIGRLEPEKGVEDAVKAAKAAGVRLTIIGDGPLAPSLGNLGNNVRHLGWLSHDEIAARVREARALLMPTRYPEPFGLVAVEASQSGIPVILSDKAYLAEEMAAAGIGIACNTADTHAFSAAIRRLLDMPREEIRAMSEKAHKRGVRLSTTPEEWRDALIDQYLSLLVNQTERAIC